MESQKVITRGIRNNNPANIVRGSSKWKGLVSDYSEIVPCGIPYDKKFCQFTHIQYGIRSLIITLRTYVRVHGLHEISDIIRRFAPQSDGNNTSAYINYVTKECEGAGIRPRLWSVDFDKGTNSEPLFRICKAICWMESNFTLTKELFLQSLKLT